MNYEYFDMCFKNREIQKESHQKRLKSDGFHFRDVTKTPNVAKSKINAFQPVARLKSLKFVKELDKILQNV